MSVQAVLIEAAAVALLLSTIVLVRMHLLSIRYGLGWLAVSAGGILGAPVLGVLADVVKPLGFTPTGFSLGMFILFVGAICLQLSVSLSGLHHALQDVAEHAALVEHRLRTLERSRSGLQDDFHALSRTDD